MLQSWLSFFNDSTLHTLLLFFFCRYCTKPKELVVECSLPTPGPLDELLESQIKSAVTFLTDHRYDPSEVYEDEFQEELKGIPDPKIDPHKILSDFLDVLHTLGILLTLIQFKNWKINTENCVFVDNLYDPFDYFTSECILKPLPTKMWNG